MILEVDFIVAALVIIALLLPLYIYRKKIFKRFYKEGSSSEFIKDIYTSIKSNYPKAQIDFSCIKKHFTEKDIERQQVLISEELANQFANYPYELKTQPSIPENHLWSSYQQNSKLKKDNKFPVDWSQRKELAWLRDKKQCNRCGISISINDANALLVKQMKHGGGFNLENIVILCNDCSRIVRTTNPDRLARDLQFMDNLLKKIH